MFGASFRRRTGNSSAESFTYLNFAKLLIIVIVVFLLGISNVFAVSDITFQSNLRADFTFVIGSITNTGTVIFISSNVITTNYDYSTKNTNSSTNYMEFGQTNYFSIIITNEGGERSNPDIIFFKTDLIGTNEPGYIIQTYFDANTNGLFDLGDLITNNTGNLPRLSIFPVLVKVGIPYSVTNETIITARFITYSTNYTNSLNNANITNDIIIKVERPKASYFSISHPVSSLISNWADVIIKPLDSFSNVIPNYKGKIIVGVTSGTFSEIDWTNISGNGDFTNDYPSAGQAVYYFEISDVSTITLRIRNNVVESNLIFVSGDGITSYASSYLFFDRLEPYVMSMSPPPGGYATLSELQDITLSFNKLIDTSTINSTNIQIYQYLKTGAKTNLSITITTNETRSKLNLHINSLDANNDILSKFEVFVSTNVKSSGYSLIANPMNSSLYNSPFYGIIYSMIDKDIGGVVDQNIKGMIIPSDVSLIIDKNSLPSSSYIVIRNLDEALVNSIQVANEKAEKNQYLHIINNFDVKDIQGTGKDGVVLSDLNGVNLVIKYNDYDNDGILDGTGISEDNLNIFYLNPVIEKWEYVGKPVIDTQNNTVSIRIYKYGKYTLLGDTTEKKFKESFVVYPNPFNPLRQTAKIRFYLDKDAYVSACVFTITGEKVRNLIDRKFMSGERVHEGEIEWDGRNGMGAVVVNGVYLIKATVEYTDGSGVKTKLWKVAIMK